MQMDNTSNRLFPQTVVTTSHTQSTRHIPEKLTLRRRCRSECLQMSSSQLSGTPIAQPKIFDDLNELRRKVAQPVFRNMLLKYSPSPLHRNQDCARNIFNFIEARSRTGALLRHNTKENVATGGGTTTATAPLAGTPLLVNGELNNGDRRDFSAKELKLHKGRPIMNHSDYSDCKHMYTLDRNGYEIPTLDINSKSTANDNNKRRVRARSESESIDLSMTKTSPNKINEKNRESDLVLKRSRDDKPLNKNGQAAAVLPDFVDAKTKSAAPNYTKFVSSHLSSHLPKPSTPRYPIKSLNGNRKLKPRHTYGKSKQKPMVLSNPPRCPTPNTPSLGESNKTNADDESDTGCSSLEDDDDLNDAREDDGNESLSEDEDSYQTDSLNSTDKKPVIASLITTESVVGGYSTTAPLCPSLFPFVPPYITFAGHNEKGPPMPSAVQKHLKWKLTSITPIVIRKVLLNTGIRLLRKTNDWMGVWGKHMKSSCFKTIRSYQKINHIPGTFQIGRKDRLWRNLQVQVGRHGKRDFGFMPRTYIIPHDLKMLRKIWTKYGQRNVKWIIKPPASARGAGIKVVNRWSQIPKRKPLIVQRYIERPFLINGSKFDLRLYVLLTSINPLRIYMHTDGLARFASVKYSEKSDTLHDRYMHLTNYSINKLSSHYSKNEDANACKGHKWTVKSLWTHLASQGVDVTALWGALRNLVLKTILAGENTINHMTKLNVGSKYNVYELFGIDVLLDSELIPWLLEVNISPSLHSASPLDLHVKGPLVQALLNTALFQVPPRIPLTNQYEIMAEQGLSGSLCYDKRIFVTTLSKSERMKHSQFSVDRYQHREDYINEILKNLTPDDVRCLLISEDELARSAPLERIFPSATSYKYLKFIENPRYYNRLLDAWEYKHSAKRENGIQLLRKLCETKIHLSVTVPPVKKDCESNDVKEQGSDTVVVQEESIDEVFSVENIQSTIQEQPPPPSSPSSNKQPQQQQPPTQIQMNHVFLEKFESIFNCNVHPHSNGIISNVVQ